MASKLQGFLDPCLTLAAADYHERGKSSTPLRMLTNPAATFVKAYIVKRGFLDGAAGFIVAVMGAVSVFFKYAKLYELQRCRGGAQESSMPAP